MTPVELLKEVSYPLRDTGILLAMIGFLLLGTLASAAGLFGLWLLVMVLPAFFRYALHLVEARARDQAPPVPDIEMFNIVGNSWSLLPLIVLSASTWLIVLLEQQFSTGVAGIAGALIVILLPAIMGILGLTYSPLRSLSPTAFVKLVRTIGPAYLRVPVAVAIVASATALAGKFGMPEIFVNFLFIYAFFLMCTMIGTLLRDNSIEQLVDIADPLESSDEEIVHDRIKARQKVANHAYGFVSRENRAGGLQHIQAWLRDEDGSDEAWAWFFTEMLTWENRDHALFFAQIYLGKLLREQQELEVQKLLSRCLLENSRFRPADNDTSAIVELLRRHGRDDILRQLQG